MKIPERLTTENTGYYAGTWHRVDGVDRYFTREYIAYCEKRDRVQRDTPVELPEDVPYQFTVNPLSRYTGDVKPVEKRQCSECGSDFTPMNPNQRTCSTACSLARRERTAAKRQERKARLA